MAEQTVRDRGNWPEAFTVRFTIQAESAGQMPDDFWKEVRKRQPSMSRDLGEDKLRKEFTEELTRRVNAAFAPFVASKPLVAYLPFRRGNQIELVLQRIQYGSLWPTFGVDDIKTFVDLIKAAGPYAVGILGTCTAESFRAVYGVSPESSRVWLSSVAESMLASQGGGATGAGTLGEKANLAFSKVFWLVPTLFMLFLFALAFETLDRQYDRVKVREEALAKSQGEVLTAAANLVTLANSRNTEQNKTNDELVKQLRQKSDKDDGSPARPARQATPSKPRE